MYLNFRPHEYCLVIVYAGDMWDGCEVSWVFYQLFLPELKRAILIVNNYCANQGITLISLPSHVNNTSKIRWAKLISLALNSAKTCSIKATIRFNYRGGKDEIYWEKARWFNPSFTNPLSRYDLDVISRDHHVWIFFAPYTKCSILQQTQHPYNQIK